MGSWYVSLPVLHWQPFIAADIFHHLCFLVIASVFFLVGK